MILGQLGWFVREKLVMSDPRRVRPAVEAVFRTDLELKSSGGDPPHSSGATGRRSVPQIDASQRPSAVS